MRSRTDTTAGHLAPGPLEAAHQAAFSCTQGPRPLRASPGFARVRAFGTGAWYWAQRGRRRP